MECRLSFFRLGPNAIKAVCFFLVLSIQAKSSVAQTASALLQNTAGFSTLARRVPKLEFPLESAAAARTPLKFSDVPNASLPQFAVNLAPTKDSEVPSVTSREFHYEPFLDGGTSTDSSTDLDTIHPQNGIRVVTEAVLRIGTW
jgi:hypothetical protein